MAEWSAAEVNRLPDDSFLFIEPGGTKDAEGKTTPRSLRHLPWKNADGTVDEAHATNALGRIPQTDGLSAEQKEKLQDKVRRALGMATSSKGEQGTMGATEKLTQIQNMLAGIVGARKVEMMKLADFVPYAFGQIQKAMAEPEAQSTPRLKALADQVSVFKDNYTDEESEGVKVTVFVPDTTALEEKSTTLKAPASLASPGAGQSFFAKMAGLQKQLDDLLKAAGDIEEGDDAVKAAKPPAPPEPPTPPGAKPAEGEGEDEEKRKKALADIEEEEKRKAKAKETEAAKVDKAIDDVSPDGTVWPSNLNDPAFVKDGTVAKSLEWGTDKSAR